MLKHTLKHTHLLKHTLKHTHLLKHTHKLLQTRPQGCSRLYRWDELHDPAVLRDIKAKVFVKGRIPRMQDFSKTFRLVRACVRVSVSTCVFVCVFMVVCVSTCV